MLSAKNAQTMARAARSRGSLAYRLQLRRQSAGQSLIVAIIVLFILLFLGGVFIALIANNLRNTRRGIQVSAADKFAEAGIKYLDQQLMNSPEGADWRPVPESYVRDPADYSGPDDDPTIDDNGNGIVNGTVGPNDPDYFWLKFYNPATDEGGYTRITFGGPTPSQSNLGGRALVRVTYRPYHVTSTGVFWDDLNGNGVYDAPAETVNPNSADRTRRYMRLESVGRVGVVDSLDPTTFKNSEGLGLRRELVAYKALGLTESLRFITDKDKRRTPAALGAPYPVLDRPKNAAGDQASDYLFGGLDAAGNAITTGTAAIIKRPIYGVYQGGIRSNTDLTFYGVNFLSLDARRGDAIEVSGAINLSGLSDALTTPAATNQTKVYVFDRSTGANPALSVANLGGTGATQVGNLLPSGSTSFSTFGGLVRDNPRGNETQDLAADLGNNNLRAVPRLEPPLLDAVIGDNGLTRYRSLTRDSAPMPISQTGATDKVTINSQYAGAYGWGENLYIPNAVDLPAFVETVDNVSSQRSEWLNPTASSSSNWRTDGIYSPPAVTITLTPRWFSMKRSEVNGRVRQYLRRPDGGAVPTATIYRYTHEDVGALSTTPTLGIDDTATAGAGVTASKYGGYPATRVSSGYYEGEYIIFAEGNVRIKGAAGGVDPETGEAFVRHLTVVSNGTIYVDGNLLRDNISPEMAATKDAYKRAKGKSTIALLAKNYIAVNTTQFLSPGDSTTTFNDSGATVLELTKSNTDKLPFRLTFGPITTFDSYGLPNVEDVYANATANNDLNRTPPYLNDPTTAQSNLSLLLRHAPALAEGTGTQLDTAVSLFINPNATPSAYLNLFDWNAGLPSLRLGKVLPSGGSARATTTYLSDVIPLQLGVNINYLYPNNQYPYTIPITQLPTIGISNLLQMALDSSGGDVTSYHLSRFGVVPMDVRIEALMYSQEGSFFVIPGGWTNPDANDTYANFLATGKRPTDDTVVGSPPVSRVNAKYPFYGEPLDIRITMFGAITENLPAEIGDQGAWLQKWGWVPRHNGSDTSLTFHGPDYTAISGVNDGVGNGINYIYDPRLASPYAPPILTGDLWQPLRPNPYQPNDPLPPMPRLPVAPGLLYYGDRPIR